MMIMMLTYADKDEDCDNDDADSLRKAVEDAEDDVGDATKDGDADNDDDDDKADADDYVDDDDADDSDDNYDDDDDNDGC